MVGGSKEKTSLGGSNSIKTVKQTAQTERVGVVLGSFGGGLDGGSWCASRFRITRSPASKGSIEILNLYMLVH